MEFILGGLSLISASTAGYLFYIAKRNGKEAQLWKKRSSFYKDIFLESGVPQIVVHRKQSHVLANHQFHQMLKAPTDMKLGWDYISTHLGLPDSWDVISRPQVKTQIEFENKNYSVHFCSYKGSKVVVSFIEKTDNLIDFVNTKDEAKEEVHFGELLEELLQELQPSIQAYQLKVTLKGEEIRPVVLAKESFSSQFHRFMHDIFRVLKVNLKGQELIIHYEMKSNGYYLNFDLMNHEISQSLLLSPLMEKSSYSLEDSLQKWESCGNSVSLENVCDAQERPLFSRIRVQV